MHATIAAAADGTPTGGGGLASKGAPVAVRLVAGAPEVAALSAGCVALALGALLVLLSARRARRRRRDRARAEATTSGERAAGGW